MNELCFCSAAYGGWGIVRVGTLVPESHLLFVCPFSCGRHNAIGAEQHGYKDQVSYLFIDEKDIALGDMTADIISAVENILAHRVKPKAILVYFSCVLYMSGYDRNTAIEELSERFPDIEFRPCLMNPISVGTRKSPAVSMHKTLTEFWDTSLDKDGGLNTLGSYVPLFDDSELPDVLKACGVTHFRQLSVAEDFNAFRDMGRSSFNLVLRPEGLYAAECLAPEMDYRFVPVSYDLSEVDLQYEQIFEMLGRRVPLDAYRASCKESIDRALKIVKDKSIAIGGSAVCRPFGLALALTKYGFNVVTVFAEGVSEMDKKAMDELLGLRPDIKVYDPDEAGMAKRIGNFGHHDMAIGFTAGYYTGASSVMNLMTDEGMFGYSGIRHMMDGISDCIENPEPLKDMIERYGLIV